MIDRVKRHFGKKTLKKPPRVVVRRVKPATHGANGFDKQAEHALTRPRFF